MNLRSPPLPLPLMSRQRRRAQTKLRNSLIASATQGMSCGGGVAKTPSSPGLVAWKSCSSIAMRTFLFSASPARR